MTVRQVVVLKPHSYKVREVEAARLNDADSVLLKVTVGGICGSDMHIIHGAEPFCYLSSGYRPMSLPGLLKNQGLT